jgi:hypothetical protein
MGQPKALLCYYVCYSVLLFVIIVSHLLSSTYVQADEVRYDQADQPSAGTAVQLYNGTRFAVTLGKCPERDGKCCAFGRLLRGAGALRQIENLPTSSPTLKPLAQVH